MRDLRARHRLIQAQLARRAGTTQARLAMKRASGRPKDLLDVAELTRAR